MGFQMGGNGLVALIHCLQMGAMDQMGIHIKRE